MEAINHMLGDWAFYGTFYTLTQLEVGGVGNILRKFNHSNVLDKVDNLVKKVQTLLRILSQFTHATSDDLIIFLHLVLYVSNVI